MSQAQSENDELQEGYQEIQIGPEKLEIPEEWTVTTVGDVASRFISGGTPDSDNEDYWGGDIPWTTAAVVEGPQFEGNKDFITQEGLKNSSASVVPEGSILFGTRVNVANVGRTKKEIAISQDLTGIVLDENKVDPDFVAWHLLLNQGKIRDRYSQGSTIQGMLTADLKTLPLLSPSLPEQRRIADILSTVDEQIQQTDEIIQETKELKRGLMQDLYTRGIKDDREMQSTRIGEIPVNWDLKIIDQHAEVVSGTHVKSDLVSDDDSLTPYITGPSDFTRNGIQVSKYTDSPTSFCEIGDTLVTVKGMSCGKSTFADSSVSISRQLKAVRPGTDLDEKYLFYWIRYKEQLLYVLAQGTRQLGLSTSDLTTLPIPVPSYEEQEEIGDILSKVDKKIDQEMESKQDLEDLKRGLMEDLLTGKVRVSTD